MHEIIDLASPDDADDPPGPDGWRVSRTGVTRGTIVRPGGRHRASDGLMTQENDEAIVVTTLGASELTAAFQTHRQDTERQLPLPYRTTV